MQNRTSNSNGERVLFLNMARFIEIFANVPVFSKLKKKQTFKIILSLVIDTLKDK